MLIIISQFTAFAIRNKHFLCRWNGTAENRSNKGQKKIYSNNISLLNFSSRENREKLKTLTMKNKFFYEQSFLVLILRNCRRHSRELCKKFEKRRIAKNQMKDYRTNTSSRIANGRHVRDVKSILETRKISIQFFYFVRISPTRA